MGRTKLSVVLVIVCAVKCLSMSTQELEEFAEYLEKTSQLHPTLKKGGDTEVEYDESDPVSENAWEESGKFEGDMVLNERQRRLIVENVVEGLSRNGVIDGSKRWPNNEVVVYIQVEHFTSDQVESIKNGIEDLERVSCVKFRPYKKGDRDAVVIQGSRRGCFSQVGYQGGYQVLNLSARHPVGRGCFRHGTVVHELLHTLGFYHMQSSPDRDDYVNIIWSNIIPQARNNFRKYNSFSVSDFGVGYDYDSVLHYSRQAFSINGQATIVPKQNGVSIGQRIGLSDKDVQKLNKMYCDADSDRDEEDENPPKATAPTTNKSNKKKKGNKPFDGHGIGYHQGKAVAIKLLPAAETYKLPDVPSFHVFDYFSKEPQILSTSENEAFRIGKEIAYSYNPPEPLTIRENNTPFHIDTNSELEPDHNEVKIGSQNKNNDNSAEDEQSKSLPEKKPLDSKSAVNISTQHGYISSADEEKFDPDLSDAFDRLSKIIKMHVYPSQTPDLSIYKMNGHYSKHNNPIEMKTENDKLISAVPLDASKLEKNEMNSDIRFIDSLYEVEKSVSENPLDYKKENYNEKLMDTKLEPARKKIVAPDNDNDKKHPAVTFPLNKYYEKGYFSLPGFEKHAQERNNKKDEQDKKVVSTRHNSDKKYIPFSYSTDKHYHDKYDFIPHYEYYPDKDEYTSIYSPIQQKDEKSKVNNDEWYQKYVPYYPDHDYYSHSKDSSREPEYDGDYSENIYRTSTPLRIR